MVYIWRKIFNKSILIKSNDSVGNCLNFYNENVSIVAYFFFFFFFLFHWQLLVETITDFAINGMITLSFESNSYMKFVFVWGIGKTTFRIWCGGEKREMPSCFLNRSEKKKTNVEPKKNLLIALGTFRFIFFSLSKFLQNIHERTTLYARPGSGPFIYQTI